MGVSSLQRALRFVCALFVISRRHSFSFPQDPTLSDDPKKKEFSDSEETLSLRRTIGAANSSAAVMLALASHSGHEGTQRIALLSFLPVLALHGMHCIGKITKRLDKKQALQAKIDLGQCVLRTPLRESPPTTMYRLTPTHLPNPTQHNTTQNTHTTRHTPHTKQNTPCIPILPYKGTSSSVQ